MQSKPMGIQESLPGNLPVPNLQSVDLESCFKYVDYSSILEDFLVEYTSIEYYWQVGRIDATQGWILHISVVKPQFIDLLHLILPVFIQQNVCFRIIRDSILADYLLEGQLGSIYLGKMICLYPVDESQALDLAKILIPLTKSFKGPTIVTDICLGGIIYSRYGSFTRITRMGSNDQIDNVYNKAGNLAPDSNNIPFSLPKGIDWPFAELAPPTIPKRPKLLNGKYYPVYTLKKDVKGNVIGAVYFSKPWKISFCIIKQGRRNIVFDDAHRDIRDRLKWQYELSRNLYPEIPMPNIFDYFEDAEDSYVAMEYVHGTSFAELIKKYYKGAVWGDLAVLTQLKILDCLLKIIQIVRCLHAKGYVHRDINPENFLFDKKGHNLWLIDYELMFSLESQRPVPPFALGTPGFMSPEQTHIKTPTIKEDVYAVGAMMLLAFTNLPPTKFDKNNSKGLKEAILSFIQDRSIADLIPACLQNDPLERPDMLYIQDTIEHFRRQLQTAETALFPQINKYKVNPSLKQIWDTTQAALDGLDHPALLGPDLHWISFLTSEETRFGNEQVGTIISPGWHTGISGPLWMLAIAKRNGFSVYNSKLPYNQSWDYIRQNYFTRKKKDTSLYAGGAGIALALSEAYRSHLLTPDNTGLPIANCFSKDNSELTLAQGVAGQELALLQVSSWLEPSLVKDLSTIYIRSLLDSQKKNGSWNTGISSGINWSITYTLANGTPGIIWCLLHYLQHHEDNKVETSAAKALNWLIAKNRLANYAIADNTLVLIKAYEVLKTNIYRDIAIKNLNTLPSRLVQTNFTLSHGFAGLGELYLDAHRVFKDAEWQERTGWIVQVLLNSSNARSSGNPYWIMENESDTTADLFLGNTGVIHFLMRYLLPDQLSHPLSVSPKAN